MKIEITFDWGLCKLCKDKVCKDIENCFHFSLYKFGFYSIMIGFSILMLKIYFDLTNLVESISGLIMATGLIIIWSVVVKKYIKPNIKKHLEKNKPFDELYG
jgi:hypothetical protein